MSVRLLLANTAATLLALGYTEADYRLPVELLAQGGAHGRFQVIESPASQVFARHGVSDNIRQTELRVRVAYVRGGGGQGDQLQDNVRGMDRALQMAARLEDPNTYDGWTSGIRRRLLREVVQSGDFTRSTVWDLAMTIEWEEVEMAGAVA